MIDDMKLISIISLTRLSDDALQLMQGKAVKLGHVLVSNRIFSRIEIIKIAQQKPAGVADTPIGVAELF